MEKIAKYIGQRHNKSKKPLRWFLVSDAEHFASKLAKIVEASVYKHNFPSTRRYYFAMKDLPKLLEELYPKGFRERRRAGIFKRRPSSLVIGEIRKAREVAFSALIGRIVSNDIIKKADFYAYGKYGIEVVLKGYESIGSERISSGFKDNHVTIPPSKPKIYEEDMSSKEFAQHLNKISELMQDLSGNHKKYFEQSENEFTKIESKFDKVDSRFDKVDNNFNILFEHLKIPNPK